MSEINELLENPAVIIGAFLLVVFILMRLDTVRSWAAGHLDKYHAKRQRDQEIDETVAEHEQEKVHMETLTDTLTTIAAAQQEHAAALNTMAISMENVSKRMDSMEAKQRDDIVVNGRASLQHLYEVLKEKDQLTINEYETFNALSERYLAAGGNGAFKNKIIPDILKKPVGDD